MNYVILGGDGKQYGPVAAEQVRAWFQDGRADADSQISVQGRNAWVPLRDAPEFADLFPASDLPAGSDSSPTGVNAEHHADLFHVGEVLGDAWRIYRREWWRLAALELILTTFFLLLFLPPWLNFILPLPLAGVLAGCFCVVVQKRMRGKPVRLRDWLGGFHKSRLVQLMVAGIFTTVPVGLGLILAALPFFLFDLFGLPGLLAVPLLLSPFLFLSVLWVFTIPLVATRRLDAWDGMRMSARLVHRRWWRTFGFLLLLGVIGVSGVFLALIGVLFTAPFAATALIQACETLAGAESAS